MCSVGREHLCYSDLVKESMFIAAPIAAALNSQRNHFMDVGTATSHPGVMPKSATLWVEDWESLEEHRCFADLIHFLVERGAQARSYG
jgi:hypothetical protein